MTTPFKLIVCASLVFAFSSCSVEEVKPFERKRKGPSVPVPPLPPQDLLQYDPGGPLPPTPKPTN